MAQYDEENPGGAYARESGYGSPEEDDIGVESAKAGRYSTYRARGFSSGVIDPETGNVVHGGTSALRGVTSGAADYEEREKLAEESKLAQEQADAYALAKVETPYGPESGTHETTFGTEVANKWDSGDWRENITAGLSPAYSAKEGGLKESFSAKGMFNPHRSQFEASEQVLGRVICTQLYSQKLIPQDIYLADTQYTKNLSDYVVRGYHFWAIPWVRLMRQYAWAVNIVRGPAIWRAEELAYQTGKRSKSNWKGKLVRLIGEPICFVIGLFINEQDYSVLYEKGEKHAV